ncbi:4'-phosphopantetheinyl transferase family protein [Kribbella sp. NPDC051620]|uniref:4'-phosphopantetheinyl transferase family protein n=1 Tax=Kribbella sp. NPDC051620 TaxID=3364120 RepID=UPI0037AEE8C8
MIQRPGTDLAPVHVWLKPVARDHRSAAHALLLDLATTLLTDTDTGFKGAPVLRHDAAGAPHVDPLAVSLSHTDRLVAVAAGLSGPVGIDLEDRYPRAVTALARRWFTPAELAWMSVQPEELEAFLHLWTAKEAVGKALGTGLRNTGLSRQMPPPTVPGPLPPTIAGPLPTPTAREPRAPLVGGLVASEGHLVVVHLPVRADAVVAVVVPVGTPAVEVCEHHGAALRSTAVSRTSFPVVVRGN